MSSTCGDSGFQENPEWIYQGGFFLAILAIAVIFWAFAFICEEYCIPAITVLCKKNNISDDIAGAIFIGAGLSSPPLFAALIGLFLSNAAIGVGTVVGGDICNHLLNMSASILVAPDRTLKLDKVGLTREVFFYMLSLIIILWSAKGNIPRAVAVSFDSSTWKNCLSITWVQSLVPVLLYGVYCLNVIFSPSIINYLFPPAGALVRTDSVDEYSLSFKGGVEDEFEYENPLEEDAEGFIRLNPENLPTSPEAMIEMMQVERREAQAITDLSSSSDVEANIMTQNNMFCSKEEKAFAPSDSNSDFPMYLKSEFYSKYDFGCIPRSRQWKLRHFTANVFGLYYRLEENLPRYGSHVRFINLFEADSVHVISHETLEFHIRMKNKHRSYKFQAADITSFEKTILFVNKFIASMTNKSPEERNHLAASAIYAVSGGTGVVSNPDSESVNEVIFTVPTTNFGKFKYYFTLIWRYMMYYTIPDVRKPKNQSKCLLSIFMCIVWLFGYSYLLIVSLNVLSNEFKINGAIMGYTVGAWASSYPALWSSVVLARHGYGDMASCNALGSNTFTNFIGLGLPWLLYTVFNSGSTYDATQDGGAAASLLILAIILIFYYIMLALNNWTLRFWMVPMMLCVYVGFVAYLVVNSL